MIETAAGGAGAGSEVTGESWSLTAVGAGICWMVVVIVCAFLVWSWYLSCGLVSGAGFPVARWGQRAVPGRVVQVSDPDLRLVVMDCWVRRGLLGAAAWFVCSMP